MLYTDHVGVRNARVCHYIALIPDGGNPKAIAVAKRLTDQISRAHTDWVVTAVNNSTVFACAPPLDRSIRTYPLPGGAGIILGRLFPTDASSGHPRREVSISSTEAAEIASTGGQALIERFWGKYVGLICDSVATRVTVIRDCSGMIPCYHTVHEDVRIVFSCASVLTGLDLPRFTPNWNYLAAFIQSSQLQIRDCGFQEIQEVLAGERLVISRCGTRQEVLWDPRRFAIHDALEDFDRASSMVRSSAEFCVGAWGSAFERIVHRLSGGFDSTAVLGCLQHAAVRPETTCLNEFSDFPQDDERRYARLAARQAGVPLIEQRLDLPNAVFDAQLFDSAMTCKPSATTITTKRNRQAIDTVIQSLAAESVWTGEGGDHLFYKFHSALGAADYVRRHGMGYGLLSVVADAGHLSRQPFWWVLRNAWRLGLSEQRWFAAKELAVTSHFVNREALPANLSWYASHPWTLESHDLPKGKQLQIYALAEVLNRHRPKPDLNSVPEHHPLLSQPLIELCLRIPTYLLVRGGRARALAHDAFRSCVPAEIVERDDKGGTTGLFAHMFRESETFLAQTLLDGVLVRERIVLREELEPYLIKHQPLRTEHVWPFIACLAAEVWLRQCSSATPHATALSLSEPDL